MINRTDQSPHFHIHWTGNKNPDEIGRVAKPFGFCPLRSVRADFPHTALPEGNPKTVVTPCRDE